MYNISGTVRQEEDDRVGQHGSDRRRSGRRRKHGYKSTWCKTG